MKNDFQISIAELDSKKRVYWAGKESRSRCRLLLGVLPRIRNFLRNAYWRHRAIRQGATIGKHSVICPDLAKRANRNLIVGDYCSICAFDIDLRAKVTIGNFVAIGHGTTIVRGQHNIDSPCFEARFFDLEIADYCWLVKALILPKCRKIEKGAVCAAGSVVVKDVNEMAVVAGNPAKEVRQRKALPADFCPAWNSGNDLPVYWQLLKRHLKKE